MHAAWQRLLAVQMKKAAAAAVGDVVAWNHNTWRRTPMELPCWSNFNGRTTHFPCTLTSGQQAGDGSSSLAAMGGAGLGSQITWVSRSARTSSMRLTRPVSWAA